MSIRNILQVGTCFRRDILWLAPHLLGGAFLVGALAVPFVSPHIHNGWVRAAFAALMLFVLLRLGLQPILAWQYFQLTVTRDFLIVDELRGLQPVHYELSRHESRLQLETFCWLLPIYTITITYNGRNVRYAMLSRIAPHS